ncbi:hypothetical protein Taro_002864 [Colocasia esculenta]|uniref:Uncharacterized protein n=1 Tax=Colocasia esculenta TaxID=4460 RepID=A0A843TM49_COLES|nr:hypothetical protein [Colocasia esculenta]
MFLISAKREIADVPEYPAKISVHYREQAKYRQKILFRTYWESLNTQFRFHTFCTGLLLNKLMVSGFTVPMNVNQLQISSAGEFCSYTAIPRSTSRTC